MFELLIYMLKCIGIFLVIIAALCAAALFVYGTLIVISAAKKVISEYKTHWR